MKNKTNIDTSSMRRCMGKFDSVLFDSVVESYRKNFTYSDASEDIARAFFVEGKFQVDIAKHLNKQPAYVQRQCKLILAEYIRMQRNTKCEVHHGER